MARFLVGRYLIWEVPSDNGPVWSVPTGRHEPGFTAVEGTQSGDCICRAEFLRSAPDVEEDFLDVEGFYPSDYCAIHGIDRINGLGAEEFRMLARHSWLWDEDSEIPDPANPDANRSLLVGFAGHGFTGVPAQARDGQVDAWSPGCELAEELTEGESVPNWEKPRRPSAGVLDRIDLHPAGYDGYAIRYRHGRAWYEPIETTHLAAHR